MIISGYRSVLPSKHISFSLNGIISIRTMIRHGKRLDILYAEAHLCMRDVLLCFD